MKQEVEHIQMPQVSMVEINISNLCNLKCLTCVRNAPNYMQPKAEFLKLAQFKKIMDRFPNLPILQICGFSEPTLNSELSEMIRYAKEKVFGVKHVEMFTNGTKLTEKITKQLATSGLNLLRVSIDGGDRETYYKVRGADLNRVIRNVRTFADTTNIPVRMESVLSIHTLDSAEKFSDVAHAIGAKELHVRLLDGQDSMLSKDSVYDLDLLKDLKQKLEASCIEYEIDLEMNLPGENSFASKCTAWNEIYIDEKGGLVPCYLLGTKPVGNLIESSFEEICASSNKSFTGDKNKNGGFLPSCCCNYALVTQDKVK